MIARPGTRHQTSYHDLATFSDAEFIDYQRGRGMAAATRLRRYARANQLQVFATLDYSGATGQRTKQDASRDPERLWAKLRQRLGRFPYAAVAEYGARDGALHWHLLLPEIVESSQLARNWNWGEVDHQICNSSEDLCNVVSYMSKDFFDLRAPLFPAL